MKWRWQPKNAGRYFVLIAVLALLGVMHSVFDPLVLFGCRMFLFGTVFVWWRNVVDALVALRVVHPLRRRSVVAFRWSAFALVVLIELFVIQRLPIVLVETLRA